MDNFEKIKKYQHENITVVDDNYIYLIKFVKYILNFLVIYLSSVTIIYNYPSVNINQFVLIICTISVISFYFLDTYFPICNI